MNHWIFTNRWSLGSHDSLHDSRSPSSHLAIRKKREVMALRRAQRYALLFGGSIMARPTGQSIGSRTCGPTFFGCGRFSVDALNWEFSCHERGCSSSDASIIIQQSSWKFLSERVNGHSSGHLVMGKFCLMIRTMSRFVFWGLSMAMGVNPHMGWLVFVNGKIPI